MHSKRLAAVPDPRSSHHESHVPPARLHLAAVARTPDQVDGAWWPRSTDLMAELPALLDSVRDRTGPAALVGFHREGWEPTPEQVRMDGESIWLEGFTDDEPHTVIIIGSSGRRLTLAVIAPDTAEAAAQEELLSRSTSRLAAREAPGVDDQQWVGELVARLVSQEGQPSERRTRAIERCVKDAAAQFVDAPIQAYVAILVEHIVRQQISDDLVEDS